MSRLPVELRAAFALELIAGRERSWWKPVGRSAERRRLFARRALDALGSSLTSIVGSSDAATWVTGLVIPADHRAGVLGWSTTDGTVAVLLVPETWKSAVLARSIAVVDGHFVLHAAGSLANARRLAATAVRWEPKDDRLIPVERPAELVRSRGDRWTLSWVGE